MFKKYTILALGALIIGSEATGSDSKTDFMKRIGKCPGFEKINDNNDFFAAGILAADPLILRSCPELLGIERYMNGVEKCMVKGLSGNSELSRKPSLVGTFKVKIGISTQPYSDDTYRFIQDLTFICKRTPGLYPDGDRSSSF